MPGKSKHSKGKRPQNKNRARQPMAPSAANATGSAAPMAATAAAPAAVGTASAPPRTLKGAAAKVLAKNMAYNGATTEQYPFFTSELKRIAVITGVLLIVLVVLAVVIR
jgi:hypothetical protein